MQGHAVEAEGTLTKPASRRRGIMLIVISISYQMVFLHGVVMSVIVNDIMLEMNLSPARMGIVGSAYLYAYAFSMLVSGIVAARFGPRRTLAFLFLLSGAGGILFATSDSFATAILGRILTAIGMSATMTSSFTLFGRWYSPKGFAGACSVCFSLGGFGTFFGLDLCSYLNEWYGWRVVFFSVALVTILYGIIMFIVVRDWPPGAHEGAGGTPAVSMRDLAGKLREVAKNRDFWRIAIWFATVVGTYFTLSGLWGVPWLENVYGMARSEAGGIVSLVGAGFILGTPLIMWFATVVLKSYRLIAGWSGVMVVGCSAYMIYNIDSMSIPALLLLFLLFGLFMNAPNTVMYASGRNLFGSEMAGVIGGVFGCAGFLGGAFLQIISGCLLDLGVLWNYSMGGRFAFAFVPFIACGIIGGIAGFGISKKSFPGGGR